MLSKVRASLVATTFALMCSLGAGCGDGHPTAQDPPVLDIEKSCRPIFTSIPAPGGTFKTGTYVPVQRITYSIPETCQHPDGTKPHVVFEVSLRLTGTVLDTLVNKTDITITPENNEDYIAPGSGGLWLVCGTLAECQSGAFRTWFSYGYGHADLVAGTKRSESYMTAVQNGKPGTLEVDLRLDNFGVLDGYPDGWIGDIQKKYPLTGPDGNPIIISGELFTFTP